MRNDFIVIGAGRSGTTWLWTFLDSHPDCFVPARKELNYFNREAIDPRGGRNPNFDRSLDWYHEFFASATDLQVRGEVSPAYLWSASAPTAIHAYNPDIKLVAILRDPVERSHSHFLYRMQRGTLPEITFEEALERNPFILERSLYARHLARYFDLFPEDQIQILFHDQLRTDPDRLAKTLELHLGITNHIEPVARKVNPSGRPRFRSLNRIVKIFDLLTQRHPLLHRAKESLRKSPLSSLVRTATSKTTPFGTRPTISETTDARLRDYFGEDVEQLEQMLGVDLSAWKRSKTDPGLGGARRKLDQLPTGANR